MSWDMDPSVELTDDDRALVAAEFMFEAAKRSAWASQSDAVLTFRCAEDEYRKVQEFVQGRVDPYIKTYSDLCRRSLALFFHMQSVAGNIPVSAMAKALEYERAGNEHKKFMQIMEERERESKFSTTQRQQYILDVQNRLDNEQNLVYRADLESLLTRFRSA